MIKQALEILWFTLIGMTPTILFFTVCCLIKWRHGKKVPVSENADLLAKEHEEALEVKRDIKFAIENQGDPRKA